MRKDAEYVKQLEEAKLDDATTTRNCLKRFLKALRALETSGKDQSCAFCGARTYKDACVIIRPGFWAEPRSFHERDCALNEAMSEAHKEIVIEEEAKEKIWNRTEGRRIARETSESVKKLLDKMKEERNE